MTTTPATPRTAAGRAGLNVKRLETAVRCLVDGAQRVEIVENDANGMGLLIWPREFAEMLAAAYAAEGEKP